MVRTTIALLLLSLTCVVGCGDNSTPEIGPGNSSAPDAGNGSGNLDSGATTNSTTPATECSVDDTAGCVPPENSTVAGCVLGECAYQCAAGFADDNRDLGEPDSDGCEGDCVPSGDEVCDGIDNDCDGETDEGFGTRESCSVGVGACAAEGTVVCAADQASTECSAEAGAPEDEYCDGLDNDCDGEVDEDFDVGGSCSVGEGACERSGMFICDEDSKSAVCSASPGMPEPETCNNIDDDCDGRADEELTRACGTNEGVCQEGVETCSAGAWGQCFGSTEPSDDLCNDLDDDCDGEVDEMFPTKGSRCQVGVGACRASGNVVCSADGKDAVCDATPGNPTFEVCNNQIDDDCDGETDENCGCNVVGCPGANDVCCYDPVSKTYGCFANPPGDQLCLA